MVTKRKGKVGVGKGSSKVAPRSRAAGAKPPPEKAPKSTARSRPKRAARHRQSEGRDVALAVAGAALDKKALQVEIIDVRGKVDYCDYVVVMSGRSDRQVNAIAKGIDEAMRRGHDLRCRGLEGLPQGAWVLMDYGDVVVHVFHEDTRGYYDLETLWIDAARVDLEAASA